MRDDIKRLVLSQPKFTLNNRSGQNIKVLEARGEGLSKDPLELNIYYYQQEGWDYARAQASMISRSSEFYNYAGGRVFSVRAQFHTDGKGDKYTISQKLSVIGVTFPCLADRIAGTHPSDAHLYQQGSLDGPAYHCEIKKRLFLILVAAMSAKVQCIVMPLLGQGAYTRNLKPKDKNEAATAFFKALSELLDDLPSVPHVILTVPYGHNYASSLEQDNYFDLAFNVLNKSSTITVARVDIIDTAVNLERTGISTAIISPTGYRAHGGAYKDSCISELDEQITRCCDLSRLDTDFPSQMILHDIKFPTQLLDPKPNPKVDLVSESGLADNADLGGSLVQLENAIATLTDRDFANLVIALQSLQQQLLSMQKCDLDKNAEQISKIASNHVRMIHILSSDQSKTNKQAAINDCYKESISSPRAAKVFGKICALILFTATCAVLGAVVGAAIGACIGGGIGAIPGAVIGLTHAITTSTMMTSAIVGACTIGTSGFIGATYKLFQPKAIDKNIKAVRQEALKVCSVRAS